MQGDLYKVTNIVNGKVYIGKTYIGYMSRWKRHISDAYRKPYINHKFYNAIRKYGIDAFEIELLGNYEQGELEDAEIKAIQLFDSFKNGYNSTLGGDGVATINMDEEHILELFDSGISMAKIAKEYNTKTTRTISAILKKHNRIVNRTTRVIVEAI